ncbi:MAG: ABC-F family ATP-binding cassette domain-containing protein [Deltaproteobacteria bacterium]|nr:ABC-F family ATP-binding cassette domain-containing protein [Deltaproteobacteria bacterium]
MTLCSLTDVHLAYGPLDVLRGVDLQLDPGARVGLVGPNGTGKTSLLKLIVGELAPDRGQCWVNRGTAVRLLRQERKFGSMFSAGARVLDVALAARADLLDLETRMHALQQRVSAHHDDAEALSALGQVTDRYEHEGGYQLRPRARAVLAGLGLPQACWEQPATSLSGGEAGRLELATILLMEPALLLLDEPTNHLDVEATEFLEGWLREFKGAALVVSHDRAFLDNTVNRIVELHNGKLETYAGNYSAFAVERDLRRERRLKEYAEQQEHISKVEAWIRKNMVSATSARAAQSKRKALARMERVEAPEARRKVARLTFPGGMRPVEQVLTARGLSHGYGDRTLFSGVDLVVKRGDKIGVAGPNGSGKSTLGRILAGKITPTAGTVALGQKVELLYFDQAQADLPGTGTPFSLVRDTQLTATNQQLRAHLGRFAFPGDEADKDVSTLSGGERARLALAVLTLSPANFLVLDEPTNHLDLDTREALEEALQDFDGTVLLISHDRYLLDAVTTRTWFVADGRVVDEEGSFGEVRERVLAARDAAAAGGDGTSTERAETAAQAHKRQEKERRALERDLQRAEQRIAELEAGLAEADRVLGDPATSWQLLAEQQKARAALAAELERLMADWERLSVALQEAP